MTSSGVVNANGGIKINNYSLPLFNNGTSSAAATFAVPIQFVSSSYNYVEVKVYFTCSANCNVFLSGNTASNGTGTTLATTESCESFINPTNQTSPTTSTSGCIANALASAGTYSHFTLKMSKGVTGTYSTRNMYDFATCYTWNAAGAARGSGVGHIDSTSLASIVLTPTTGNISGTWNTIHFY